MPKPLSSRSRSCASHPPGFGSCIHCSQDHRRSAPVLFSTDTSAGNFQSHSNVQPSVEGPSLHPEPEMFFRDVFAESSQTIPSISRPQHAAQHVVPSLPVHSQAPSESAPTDQGEISTSQSKSVLKSRRERPFITLAEDQPLTTQGKPRARVFVACLQCRTRKIRCDGAKPACHNCGRRSSSGDTECKYDAIPKRRGPDRLPGARHRTTREASDPAPIRRRQAQEERNESPVSSASHTSQSDVTPTLERSSSTGSTFGSVPQTNTLCTCHGSYPCPNITQSFATYPPAVQVHHQLLSTPGASISRPFIASNTTWDSSSYIQTMPQNQLWCFGENVEEPEESRGPPSPPSANLTRKI
ncbi:hypothetical protein BDN72DRAFT_545173 [Pluteus cervinus]|uniref:Uncharacterized protein n=1 Tax=Pluteus cervinus TaxID=181527 RepID=A0ACD3AXG2_9AGAR|nr:hypothetical protein BDN72DRAFT_545173 [Pluteus cervinus]